MKSHARTAHRGRTLPAVLAAIVLPAASVPAQSPSVVPGFRARTITLPKPTKSWTGPEVLPDGRIALFDGQNLLALDPSTGRIVQTLVRLSAAAWGTSIVLGPSKRVLYFGESSTGALYAFDLARKSLRRFARLQLHYDLAFHPIEGERFLYATAKPNTGSRTQVYRIDTLTGGTDLIAEETGWSGPLAFDHRGNLYTAPAPLSFGKPGLGRVLRWPAAKVLGAIGPGVLREKEARLFVKAFDNARDFVIDGQGTFYLTDGTSKTSSLLEVGPKGGSFAKGLLSLPGLSLSGIAFSEGTRPFERFGSPGSRIFALAGNYTGTNLLVVFEPARPALSVVPSSTPAPGRALTFTASGMKGAGLAVWMFGTGRTPEMAFAPLGAGGLAFPDFGIVPTLPLLVVVGRVNALGVARFSVKAPSTRGIRWTTQVLAGPLRGLPGGTPPSPWFTSTPTTVQVR